MNLTSKGACLSENSEALPASEVPEHEGTLRRKPAGKSTNWYAVRTSAWHEKSVRDHIQSRDLECFLPLYHTDRRWKNGCKKRIELPLFPGYLFVAFDLAYRTRILEVPGVLSLVGVGPCLWPLPEVEIEALRAGLHLRNPEPHTYLTAGQRVRIKAGPLAGLTGILVRKKDRLRVVLSVEMLMVGVAVEVHVDDIETLGGATDSSRSDLAGPNHFSLHPGFLQQA